MTYFTVPGPTWLIFAGILLKMSLSLGIHRFETLYGLEERTNLFAFYSFTVGSG